MFTFMFIQDIYQHYSAIFNRLFDFIIGLHCNLFYVYMYLSHIYLYTLYLTFLETILPDYRLHIVSMQRCYLVVIKRKTQKQIYKKVLAMPLVMFLQFSSRGSLL